MREATCEWMGTQTDSAEASPVLKLYGQDLSKKNPFLGDKNTWCDSTPCYLGYPEGTIPVATKNAFPSSHDQFHLSQEPAISSPLSLNA